MAARGGPAPPGLDDLPGRDQRAARPVPRRRPDGRASCRRWWCRGWAVVRGAPARRRPGGCGWPRSPTPTRTSCPSCARCSTPTASRACRRSCAPRLAELVATAAAPRRCASPSPTDGIAVPLRARGRLGRHAARGPPGGPPAQPRGPACWPATSPAGPRWPSTTRRAPRAHVRGLAGPAAGPAAPRAAAAYPDSTFAAEYLPASTGSDVGGDFYDVLTVDPTRWLVVDRRRVRQGRPGRGPHRPGPRRAAGARARGPPAAAGDRACSTTS